MNNSYPTTWDLRSLLSKETDEEIAQQREIIAKANTSFIQKWKDNEAYLTNATILRQALDEYEELMRQHGGGGSLGYYFALRSSLDQNDPEVKAKTQKVDDFTVAIENELQSFTMRLAKIPEQKQQEFLSDPQLKEYHYFLQSLFKEAQYLLSEPEEKILNLKSDVSSGNWRRMVSALLAKRERKVVDEDGKETVATLEMLTSLINNRDKKVRDVAAEALNEILAEVTEVAEIELNSLLANKKIDDELRGFTRPDQARHVRDDVETEVVEVLLNTVASQYPISQRYYALKAALLGVDKLEYHERNVEYGSVNKKYPFEEAVSLVERAFLRLDPEFADILSSFLKQGQFDVFPRKGKRGGAFCAYSHLEHPVYVLLNHTDTLNDVLTIAHEMGHGINDELSRKTQNALNYGTSTYTAEVASTFMEDFVLEELLTEADDELRLTLLMMKLNDDVSSIFRQVACYRFELELHDQFRQKGYLSQEEIGALFLKHMRDYLGNSVNLTAGSENWWVYWQHIRMFFYVYSYASGLLISKSLQASVRENPAAITPVKAFLSSGRSQSPATLFAGLGFNLKEAAFWQKGLAEIESLVEEAESLARKLGKI